MTEELTIILGAVGAAVTAIGGVAAERWRAKREQKTADQEASNDTWSRSKDLMASLQQQLADLRAELKQSEKAGEIANADCDKRVSQVRLDFESDLNQAYSKIKILSKVCLDQQLEMDGLAIEVSKLRRKGLEHDPLPGGRRLTDEGASTQAIVTTTVSTPGATIIPGVG